MTAGRPSTYDPDYCAQVIALGREGASKAEMAHALGCSRQTMDTWAANHPEFLDAVKEATEAAQGWWESEGRKATFGSKPGFNATSFIFNMKNRFPADWRDKQDHELTGKDGKDLMPEDANAYSLARRIAFALAQAGDAKPTG
ncbi:MAG: hypothetical protein EOR57_31505 [Mesorhizobium sp.]|uniref:helix-turn-helix domain-containing protein n=1 Tax=Mesorhizobium sp. TaxID=1871066 RepID=UPI000FE464DF|nr:helix-turn-helix domain-containing protein [Mesorhizobium sp.]RWL14874.1 MAG: hypothetical protein EOR57_31505 [Mesorhizobium sp.]